MKPEPIDCPKWGDMGHNWLALKNRWFQPWWWRNRVCCACGYMERIK